MAWKLYAIEQTQLRRQSRVDGVGRPKFDFHTGRAQEPPKKKQRRAERAKREAAVAAGTHVPNRRCDGEGTGIMDKAKKHVKYTQRRKTAYNRLERHGLGAARGDWELRLHAEHKAHLESCRRAYYSKGKK